MCRRNIEHPVEWCCNNTLLLNVNKAKELIIDFRKGKSRDHISLAVEEVKCSKFLGVNMLDGLSWTQHRDVITKKAS